MTPPARPAAVDRLLQRLGSLGERVRTDEDALRAASGDESGLPGHPPAAVVLPQTPDEVALVCREAADLGVGLVPRGGGTGKAGGCIPRGQDVVVDVSRMNRVLEIRPADQSAVVEPGVINAELDGLASTYGYMYPPDPASRESCTLGGNIATNAGGPRALKYGVTLDHVWGLDLVLPGGQAMRLGRNSLKGVAGLGLAALLVGSEGTLGFITRAVLRIVPSPPDVETAWLSFPDAATASRAAEAMFSAGILPRMLEVMDGTALDLVRPVSTFAIPQAGAALLVETDGQPGVAMQELSRLCEIALEHGATDSALAMSERDREGMRRARRLVSPRMKETYPLKFSDDVAVPRSRMVEILETAQALGAEAGLPVSAYGHLGDGNVHINLLCKTAEERAVGARVQRQVLAAAVALGGTITGEHGVGIIKRDHLSMEQSADVIELQRRVKAVFDPHGIMNPGKVL